MEKITRFANIELRANNENEEQRVEGVAVVFDQETDLGMFYEKIDRHAFDECDMSDVYLLFNHDTNYPLARTLNGTLKLSAEDDGLHQSSNIISTSQGNDIFKLVREGLIDKMSFAFMIDRNDGEEWTTDSDGNEHRLIRKVSHLYDVSLVTYPAYSTTSAFARSVNELDDLAKKHFEERKQMDTEVREAEVEEVVEETVETTEARETTEVVEEREKEMNTVFEVEKREADNYLDSAEYRSAWCKAVTGRGDAELNAIKEARGLSTTSATLVPTYVANKIETTWAKNRILNEVSVIYSAAKLSFPVESANSGAVFHAEGTEAPAEQTETLIDVLLQPMTVKKWLSVTTELIDSGEIAIMDFIVDELTYNIFKKIDESIINGALVSGKGVEGIINSTLVNNVSGGALDGATFYKGMATLVDPDAPVLIMNYTDFYSKVMGLKDTTGRPIFNVVNGERYINEFKVLLSNAVPTNKAIVGDLSAFRLEMDGRTPKFVIDEYTLATEDKVRVIGRMMTAGAVTKKNKLAVVSFTVA